MIAFSDGDIITGSLAPRALHFSFASGQDSPKTRIIFKTFSKLNVTVFFNLMSNSALLYNKGHNF